MPAEAPGGPVGSETIPLLDMEGMYDANRRPENGRELVSQFANATLVEFGDRAHVVIDDCAVSMMSAFMEDPTQAPDTSCVPDRVEWVLR